MLMDLFLYGTLPISHPANWGCALFFRTTEAQGLENEDGILYAWDVEVADERMMKAPLDMDPVFIYLRYCARFHSRLVEMVESEKE